MAVEIKRKGEGEVAPRAAPWRDPRVRSIVSQVVTLLTVALFVAYIVHNTLTNLERQGIASGFRFLGTTAGFDIEDALGFSDLGFPDLLEEEDEHRPRGVGEDRRGGVAHEVGELAEVPRPFARHQAELGEVAAHRVDQLGALPDQESPGPMQHGRGLLLDRLDRDEAHGRPDHGLADRLGVGGVVLVRLDEGLHVLGRDQPDLVAEGLQLPRPVVRARAGLDADQARRQPGEERGDLAAP